MEVALTFGSVGDIITLCQLAVQLRHALDEAGGSTKRYQDLRKDLESFINILMQVVATYEQHEHSPWLQGLDQAAQNIANDCSDLIRERLDCLRRRYGDHLDENSATNSAKRAYKKLEFSLREKERILELQEKLQRNTERLSLLTALATHKCARVDSATLKRRLDGVHNMIMGLEKEQTDVLDLLGKQEVTTRHHTRTLRILREQSSSNARSCGTILAYAKDSFAALVEMKAIVATLAQNIIQLQFQASNAMFFRGPDPTRGLPVTFEDALGFILDIPLDWIDDWESFHSLLAHRFKDRKGFDMVLNRQYTLEEYHSGQVLTDRKPWKHSIRRGMKIEMSMVFCDPQEDTCIDRYCPRCNTQQEAYAGAKVNCRCGMWFRKLLSLMQISTKHSCDFGSAKIDTPPFLIPDVPSDFQRVQLIRSVWFPGPDTRGRSIELDARWTRIDRSVISAEALKRRRLRYEARPKHIAILGVLAKDSITSILQESALVRHDRLLPDRPSAAWSVESELGKVDMESLADSFTYMTTQEIIQQDELEGRYFKHGRPSQCSHWSAKSSSPLHMSRASEAIDKMAQET